jgi:hypothetical protein
MKPRRWFLHIGGLLVIVTLALYLYYSGADLRTQLLDSSSSSVTSSIPPADDCSKLAEEAANECYAELALRDKDASVCDQITKASEKKSCQREVELTP